MRYAEAATLKKGELVIIAPDRNKHYGGLVLEIESICPEHDNWCYRVNLKQPGFDSGFRITNYDTRLLKRYES